MPIAYRSDRDGITVRHSLRVGAPRPHLPLWNSSTSTPSSAIVGRMTTPRDLAAPMPTCPECFQIIQRTPTGTVLDGLAEHAEFLHPDLDPLALVAALASILDDRAADAAV